MNGVKYGSPLFASDSLQYFKDYLTVLLGRCKSIKKKEKSFVAKHSGGICVDNLKKLILLNCKSA